MMNLDAQTIFLIALSLVYLAGFAAAFVALFQARTSQGAAAWVVSLITLPFIALPLFISFGKRRLKNYSFINVEKLYPAYNKDELAQYYVAKPENKLERFFSRSEHPMIRGNDITLLMDGPDVFGEMFKEIEKARDYILLQMYIFRGDHLGRKFADLLAQKSGEGVKVYVLYDNFTMGLSDEICSLWDKSGVRHAKHDPGRKSTFHLNFRNHRKLLVIDGSVGFFGGVNIGDDYMGLYPEIGKWRDTNVKIKGPALMVGQLSFTKDWFWSKNETIDISWDVAKPAGAHSVIVLNSGPNEEVSYNLFEHVEIMHSANKKLWIANPYLVPPQGILDALIMARIRKVDVRILIPACGDNSLVSNAGKVHCARLLKYGVRIFKYPKGMMHQKVILSDRTMAMVGSSNLDFRSMYINFENGIVSNDEHFIQNVEEMLAKDFADSKEVTYLDYKNESNFCKLKSHVTNLLAPIL